MVRYRAPKASDASTTTFRDLIPSKLATAVWNCIEKYKSIPNFPQTETCELLILDRSVDQVTIIFTYHVAVLFIIQQLCYLSVMI